MDYKVLVFTEPALEQAYQEHFRKSKLQTYDLLFVFFNCSSAALHYAAERFGFARFLSQGPSIAVAYILTGIANTALLLFSKPAWLHSHRTATTVVFRLLYHTLTVLGIPYWVLSTATPAGAFRIICKQVLLGSGSLLGFWFALGMPLLFQHSLLLALVETAICIALLPTAVCNSAMATAPGTEVIQSLWHGLDRTSRLTISLYFQGHTPLAFPPHHNPCFPTVLFLQLMLGLLCPLAILYLLELHSRAAFAAARQDGRGPLLVLPWALGPLQGGVPDGPWATYHAILVGALCTLLVLTGFWELSNTAALLLVHGRSVGSV